jgi:hypothetical protein
MNIVDISFSNDLHCECIWKLSKNNNFHKNDLHCLLYGDISEDILPFLSLVTESERKVFYSNIKQSMYKNNLKNKGLFICEEKKPVGYLLYYLRDGEMNIIDLTFLLIDKKKE